MHSHIENLPDYWVGCWVLGVFGQQPNLGQTQILFSKSNGKDFLIVLLLMSLPLALLGPYQPFANFEHPFLLSHRCTFPTNDACLEWYKRLSHSLTTPRELNKVFAFAFYAWCMENVYDQSAVDDLDSTCPYQSGK
jgi:hypothetical protein